MNRRRLLQILGAPALLAAGGLGYAAAARSRNPYYQGPVSDHFDGVRFFNPGRSQDRGILELLRWQLGGGREPWPDSYPSPFEDSPPERVASLRVVLIGHASLLIQVAGLNILVDPVYSERASPFSFVGPKRVNPPGIAFDRLPPIDAVLITHNHYDHLDVTTLTRLWHRDCPRMLAPLGNDAVIQAHDPAIEVETRDWGQSLALSEKVQAHLEPVYHWSARGMNDRRMALWTAYVLSTPLGPLYIAGDSGYGDGAIFGQARERFGPPRLAILPIGAYEPRWFMQPQHMNPEEALAVMEACGAKEAVGVHWGTFRLTNEAVDAPLAALGAALAQKGVPVADFRPLRPGEVWSAEA